MSSGGVMLSGWLRKSPPENKLKSRHHSWKKRFFVLKSGRLSGDPNVLEYSKYQTSKKPIKIINLNDCLQIDANVTVPVKVDKKDTSEHYIFSIVTSNRTFYLIADSVREMSTWVQCLCDLCGFNHDSRDKGDLGRQKQTFKPPQPTNHSLSDGKDASGMTVTTAPTSGPRPSPQPMKTVIESSRLTEHPTSSLQNGTINSSFTRSSQDGYEDSHLKSDWNFESKSILHGRADVTLTRPTSDSDPSGYLHLADCDTGPGDIDSAFLSVDKTDNRRSSTDSVFAHDDLTDGSKEDETLAMPIIMPKSRFLQDGGGGRLDSMPTVPPPPPPTEVPRRRQYDDDDEDINGDIVVEARRKPTFHGIQPSKLPPIDDTNLYNVPPGLQRDNQLVNDALIRPGSNNSSSHGSMYGGDGRYAAIVASPPDYVNTQESISSGSLSASGHCSGSSISSTGHLSTSPANLGNQIYDFPSQLSPVFPMSKSLCPLTYQTPQPLERGVLLRNGPNETKESETAVKEQLKNVEMLDVGAAQPSKNETVYASAQDIKSQRPNDLRVGVDSDETYAVPPVRPPKPTCPPVDLMSENLYSSPRNHSTSSCGAIEQPRYDLVKQQSSLSPPHTTIVRMPGLNLPTGRKMPSFCNRNAISASNSPIATPDMSRKIEIKKVPSFNSRISPLAQTNKAVSGSAPSLYDVPQRLSKPASHDEAVALRESNIKGSNTDGDTNIYDQPRKLKDVSSYNSITQNAGANPKIDDSSHPSYEKMASQTGFSQEDQNPYTAMAGINSPSMHPCLAQVPPIRPIHTRLLDDIPSHDIPPPVHRDLKPGRKSLGSDGGSSQTGLDHHKKSSRDSYGSDEAVSPPHSLVSHTFAVTNEQKQFPHGLNCSPTGSRNGSITSPQHAKFGRSEDCSSRMGFSPTPPQRPPKCSFSSASPRSPPMPASPNETISRPYTSQGAPHKTLQSGNDRLDVYQAGLPPAPERPPKPASMRLPHISSTGQEESRMPPKRPPKSIDDQNFTPARPPKPSNKTPSTGDSLNSASFQSPSFFPSYGPSSVVPPPPVMENIDRQVTYIEISTTQGNAQVHPNVAQPERNLLDGPVQYIELDVGKTQALEKMKKERAQSKLQQRTKD